MGSIEYRREGAQSLEKQEGKEKIFTAEEIKRGRERAEEGKGLGIASNRRNVHTS